MKMIMMGCAVAATALVFSTSSIAEDSKPFSGPYVGVEGGFGTIKNYARKHNSRWSIGGVAGYRHQFDNDLVLGLEGAINSVSDIEASNFNTLFDWDYKPTWSASAILGYAFGDGKKNLLFAKAGYSRLRYEVQLGEGISGEALTFPAGTLGKFSKGALKLGAGYERKLTDMLSVRIGADYTKHKDLHKQLEAKMALIVNF